jgi:hypothetical protein
MDAPSDTPIGQRAPARVSWLRVAWRSYLALFRLLAASLFAILLVVLTMFFINYVVLSTPKDRAYRNLDPASPVCAQGLAKGWTILADLGRSSHRMIPDDDGWVDPTDDEAAALAADPAWQTSLRCSLQRHVIPSAVAGHKAIDFSLGFLEFREDGEPYALLRNERDGDHVMTSAMLQQAMAPALTTHVPPKPVITQLNALQQHLATGSNYVIVFVHGWRHDARIGDQNVADLRLYAAHAARFLAQRCESEHLYCDTKVTAIYVGWRGARVDEFGLKQKFGETIGGFVGSLSTGATLFDRKPVSEQVAPAAISALRSIQAVLAPKSSDKPGAERNNRMLVIGHSLGGNMLATGLGDEVVKRVKQHKPGDVLAPVLGDMVVLINPAAEAAKWTAFQREVWTRTDEAPDAAAVFPVAQKPVLVSVTAALAFPVGGLRAGDCAWIGIEADDGFREARKKIRQRLAKTDSMFADGVDYDWATHDLFPTFKFDFRPAAAFLDRVAARIEGRQPHGMSCAPATRAGLLSRLLALPARGLSRLAETFPFQNSSQETSHTIGNLDPPRPAAGLLADAIRSGAPFGTTHELLGMQSGMERHNPYATLADAALDCPAANRWLTRARLQAVDRHGAGWDSAALTPPVAGSHGESGPAARFLHGFTLSGTAPITQANDPFWNMRAFDDALSRHDGYRLSSFICAMNQLVMDDITGADGPGPAGAPIAPQPTEAARPERLRR